MKVTIKGSTSNSANDKAICTAQHSLCMPTSKPTSRNSSRSFDSNEKKTERLEVVAHWEQKQAVNNIPPASIADILSFMHQLMVDMCFNTTNQNGS